MEVKDVNWRSLWRELTSNGWKARPPRGIEQEHRYVPPGGNARGKEGEDYFLGTTAVIQNYLDRLSGPQDTSTQDSDVAGSREDVGPEEPQVLDVVAPVDNGGGADTIEDDNGADMPLEDAGCDQEAEPSVDEETKTEDHDQPPPRTPRRPVHRVGALPEIAIVGEDDDGGDDATDELVNSLNRMGPDDDPDTYEVFDSGNDSDADDFDKQQEADDAQLIVVDGSDDESDSEDDPIGGNGAGETRFNEGFLRALGGSTALESGALNSDVLRDLGLSGYEAPVSVDAHHILQQPYVPAQCGGDYPGLKDSYYGPSAAIKKVGETPLALFLFFMPPALWRDIAVESNLYHLSTINKRADAKYTKHKRKNPSSDKTRAQFKAVLQQIRPIQAVELLHMVGLLLARAIQPNRERMSHHWSTHDEGGISRGSFGNYMARDRFFHIMRNLHFSDNNDERSRVDRIWKIRPVVDALQKTFRSGYVPPPRLVFDEGMLPSFSSYNKTRVYLKAKPHKWGTKMFLTCCAESAYCIRFEIYAGKKQLASELPGVEPTSMPEGPAAVVRNMRAVLGRGHPEHYLVVTDRFYTCAALAVQLLAINVYILGTALPNRLGFCKAIVPPSRQKRRPRGITRGTHTVANCKSVPQMKACVWWDNRPVLFLTTGGSAELERIVRREGAQQVEVVCPKFVKQYQNLMGGVDRHDQLRLQRYSLQLSNRWLKYYKSLFFGLVDMAVVNAYIIYRELHQRRQQTPPLSHVQFLKELHLQLLQLTEADLAQPSGVALMSPTLTPPSRSLTDHVAIEVDEWQKLKKSDGTEHSKRRQRSCKVCSLLRGERKRGYQTTFYCGGCSDGQKRVYLCTRARRSVKGAPVTCFDLWHHDWQRGRSLPQGLTLSMIRARAPATKPQKRRRLDSELEGTLGSDDEQNQ